MNEPKINERFRALIPPLSPSEFSQLENNIVTDGCRDAIVLWKGTVIDGHNRLAICKKHDLKYKTTSIDFESDIHVELWIRTNQLGRRNITDDQRAMIADAVVELQSKLSRAEQARSVGKLGGRGKRKTHEITAITRVSERTRTKVAKQAKVSERRLSNARKVRTAAPALAKKVEQGEMSMKDALKQIRKETSDQKEKEALKTVNKDEKLWNVVSDQSVTTCTLLVTDPPYGIIDEPWEPKKLETFTRKWAERWNTCGADTILIFWSQRHMWNGRDWFDQCLSKYRFQQLLIWHYPNNKSPQSRLLFKQTYEPIFFYRLKNSERQIKISGSKWGGGLNDFDCHVAAVPQSNFNDADRKQHPAQKPVSVFKWLINALSDPGDMVCDPFIGSGTSGIAACQLKRRFHGIETDTEYLKLAERRIAAYGEL